MCFWIAKERFDTGLKLLSSYFPEHPFVPSLSTGGCKEQTINDESFTCIQRSFPANAACVSISTLVLLCPLILFSEVLLSYTKATAGTFPSYSLTGVIFFHLVICSSFWRFSSVFLVLHPGSLPPRTQTELRVVGYDALLHYEGKRQLSFLSQSFSTPEIPTCLYLFMASQLV